MSKKERLSWNMKGLWYEACAAEGHCSLYFGRDLEESCKSFQFFQIDEGKIGDIDISGVLAINVIDLYSNKAAELMAKGGEGGVYISDATSEEQKKYLEPLFANGIIPFSILKKTLGTKFVDISFSQEGRTFHIKMPNGEMKQSLTLGVDGKNPIRLENYPQSIMLKDLKLCNTHFWSYNDFGRDWEFKNRSGALATFDVKGKSNKF